MEKTLPHTHSTRRNNTFNIIKKSCGQEIFSITSFPFSDMFPIFDVNKPHFVKCTYKEQYEGFGKWSWPFKSINILNYLFPRGSSSAQLARAAGDQRSSASKSNIAHAKDTKGQQPNKSGPQLLRGLQYLNQHRYWWAEIILFCNDLFHFQANIEIFLDLSRLPEPGAKIKY